MNNKAIGINFETNIRESLQSDYGWKNVGFKEAFFYTEIKINGQTEIITSVNKKAINVNNNIAIFQINKNKSLEIIEDEKVIKNENNELPKNITVFDQFKNLKYLDLSYNKISDINILEKVNFNKLEELNLKDNEIRDITILEKVNFKQLQQLNLRNNEISDYSILEKIEKINSII